MCKVNVSLFFQPNACLSIAGGLPIPAVSCQHCDPTGPARHHPNDDGAESSRAACPDSDGVSLVASGRPRVRWPVRELWVQDRQTALIVRLPGQGPGPCHLEHGPWHWHGGGT
jgi:hypothetical protein